MTADPRYPADGLAELVDELEQRVAFEAWRPRYITGVDPALLDDVVVAELDRGRLWLLPEPPRFGLLGAELERTELDVAAELERIATTPPVQAWRRYLAGRLTPTQETPHP